MHTHVKVLAVLLIVFGALGVVGALFSTLIFSVLAGVVGASGDLHAPLGAAILGLAGAALTAVLLILSVPTVICGFGLLKLRPWARILGIIVSAISLIRFPLFTILGVYGLWVLFQKDTEALFRSGPA